MFLKRFQLGLIHIAVAMTLVPINSTLNRVMIKELAFSATLVALLASLPYIFSPIQMLIGSFSDRHPVLGFRRTPYIVLGLLLCVAGVILAPQAVFLMASNWWAGLALSIITFGAWGMGFNFATVSYFSLASELSGEHGRSRTIAVMFFMMIASIIVTPIGLSRLLIPYSPEMLVQAFRSVGLLALVLGLLGLLRLEKRSPQSGEGSEERYSWNKMTRAVFENRQVGLFFIYLILMLAAILGQDILLEPFAAETFRMQVEATTRITSIWGTCVLLSLVVAGFLEGRVAKRTVVKSGSWGAIAAFILLAVSGILASKGLFYTGVVLLGLATGLATVSNLSFMLDMTIAGKVGLFIGAWGMADALARLTGSVMSGVVRDVVSQLTDSLVAGYIVVFSIEAGLLLISLLLFRNIRVGAFRREAGDPSVVELAAIANEV